MEGPQAAKDFVAASYFVNYEASSSTSSPAGQLSAEQQEQCPPESSVSRLVPQLRRTLDGIVDAVYSVGAAAKESGERVESLLPKANDLSAEANHFRDQAQALREHMELQQRSSLTENPVLLIFALLSAAALALCVFGAAVPWGVGLGAAGFTAGGIALLRKRSQDRRRDTASSGGDGDRRPAV